MTALDTAEGIKGFENIRFEHSNSYKTDQKQRYIQTTMSRRRNTKKKKATRMVDAVDSDDEDYFGGAIRDSSLVKNAAKKTKGKSSKSSSSGAKRSSNLISDLSTDEEGRQSKSKKRRVGGAKGLSNSNLELSDSDSDTDSDSNLNNINNCNCCNGSCKQSMPADPYKEIAGRQLNNLARCFADTLTNPYATTTIIVGRPNQTGTKVFYSTKTVLFMHHGVGGIFIGSGEEVSKKLRAALEEANDGVALESLPMQQNVLGYCKWLPKGPDEICDEMMNQPRTLKKLQNPNNSNLKEATHDVMKGIYTATYGDGEEELHACPSLVSPYIRLTGPTRGTGLTSPDGVDSILTFQSGNPLLIPPKKLFSTFNQIEGTEEMDIEIDWEDLKAICARTRTRMNTDINLFNSELIFCVARQSAKFRAEQDQQRMNQQKQLWNQSMNTLSKLIREGLDYRRDQDQEE